MSEVAVERRPQPPRFYRWLVLLACSVAMFGNYYVFDALYPVSPLLEKTFAFTGEQIGALDTAYNVAALIALLGGVLLVDRLGTIRSAVLFGTIGALGSLLIATLPALMPQRPWAGMMAGRFVLGLGAELYIVVGTTVVGRWFKGKEVSFALAVQLLIARFGSILADRSPGFASRLFDSWQPPLLLATALGAVWFVFALVYAALEAHAARRWAVGHSVATDKLVLSDLVRFDRGYWWVVGLCVAFYATIFPFRTFANLYLIQAHGQTEDAAGALKSWLPTLSMIGMPLFGLLVDHIGKRALMMAVGSAILVPPFFLMAYTHIPLEVSMAMLGLAFAMVPAVLWPAVTYLVPDERLGSAYSLMTFCQQVGWAAMSWGLGRVKDVMGASEANPQGWTPLMWMLGGLASLGFVFSFLLWTSERGAKAHGLERASPGKAAVSA
jgi:MFS family permease